MGLHKWEVLEWDWAVTPGWLRSAIERIRRTHSGSSALHGRTFYLRGHSFRYKLMFSGQGGCNVVLYRRPRHRRVIQPEPS